MDALYREQILDHYKHPHNFGELDDADLEFFDSNPLCGDELRVQLKLDSEGRVEDVAFTGHGCAISQASASLLTERLKGLTLDEAQQVGKDDVLEELGIDISPARLKCALLSLKVLKVGAYGLAAEEEDEQ
jgi:nitrogen fixation protein NifU and related proteins